MKIAQQETAVASFYEQVPLFSATQRDTILEAIKPGCDYSMIELAKITGFEKSSISPRLNEMVKAGVLERGPERKCKFSNITIKPVRRRTA